MNTQKQMQKSETNNQNKEFRQENRIKNIKTAT